VSVEKHEAEKIFKELGWRGTKAAPSNVLDYKTFNDRIILWPGDLRVLDEEKLREWIAIPREERRFHSIFTYWR